MSLNKITSHPILQVLIRAIALRALFVLKVFLLCSSNTYGLVLETLVREGKVAKMLEGKKLGYYVGGFNPLHLGHEEILEQILDRKFCDYILITALDKKDELYKSPLININYRNDMLFAVFAKHSKIIVTRMGYQQISQLFENIDAYTCKAKGSDGKLGFKTIGIIGSDVALESAQNASAAIKLVSTNIGCTIHPVDKYSNNAIIKPVNSGKNKQNPDRDIKTLSDDAHKKYITPNLTPWNAIGVSGYIVAVRRGNENKLKDLCREIVGKPVLAFIGSQHYDVSSNKIRDRIKEGVRIDQMINPKIADIIKQHKLYK